jgi:poly-gamma-glutamate capsule biosynthesis protein CapA/YwtB (metallophosphatase superfamily)
MSTTNLVLCGDLVLDEPEPDYWLSDLAAEFRHADLAVGHLEVPHTRAASLHSGDVPAPGADPEHLAALKRAGMSAVSLAGNHIGDCGEQGIADTIRGLEDLSIAHCGAGANLAEARAPAMLSHDEHVVAFLSYNCVGPESSWAGPDRAGCAYVRVAPSAGGPIAPSANLSEVDQASLRQMRAEIAAARRESTHVLVALHKGIVHTPARLAPYERMIAHAAIDAGADIVIGHHAHILRGIELYRGKPIFHGLGNGCVVTRALSPEANNVARASWARKRRELFGFEPDAAYELAPFHPEAVNGMLAEVALMPDGTVRAGFVPLFVEAPGKPTLARGERFAQVVDYVERITRAAGLEPLNLKLSASRVTLQ